MSRKITIAIDGYSSTGKSTLARELAKKLSYGYVDSGAMYRAVALYALEHNMFHPLLDTDDLIKKLDTIHFDFIFNKERGCSEIYLNGRNVEKEIRQMEVSQRVSEIAAIPEVRRKLVRLQQKLGSSGGVVMDGRDIGTVVFPHAELKIFMTAREDVRVDRRYKELIARNEEVYREDVRLNLEQRDLMDSTREDSPLRKAEDARVLDNSDLTAEVQLKMAYEWAKELLSAN